MNIVTICTDMAQFRLEVPDITDVNSSLRGMLEGRSGAYTVYSADGNSSMKLMSSTDSIEFLEDLPYIIKTSLEEVFGYRVQRVVDGELQWTTETVNVPEKTIYHDNWVETGATDEMGMPVYENQPIAEVIPASSYERQVPVYDEIDREPGMLELYKSIWPYDVPDEDGNTRSQFFVTFGPKSVEHILAVP